MTQNSNPSCLSVLPAKPKPPGKRVNTLEEAIKRHQEMANAGRNLRIDDNVVCDGTKCTGKSGSDQCQKPIWLNIAIQYLGLNEGGNGTSGMDYRGKKPGEKDRADDDGPRHDYRDRTVIVNEGMADEKKFKYNREGESEFVKKLFEIAQNFDPGETVRTYDSEHAWCGAFVHFCFLESKYKVYNPPARKLGLIVTAATWKKTWGKIATPPCIGAVGFKAPGHVGFIVGKGMAITQSFTDKEKFNLAKTNYKKDKKKYPCPEPVVARDQMCYFLLGANQNQEVNITPYSVEDVRMIQVPESYKWCKKDEQLEDTKWVNYWYSQNPDRTVKDFSTR